MNGRAVITAPAFRSLLSTKCACFVIDNAAL